MRTSKVLVGSVVAIAAALQIGMAATASAAEGESLSVAAVALDPDGKNLLVDVLYTCAEGSKHKSLSVTVEEDAKKAAEGEEPPPATTGMGMAPTGDESDPEMQKLTCDGTEQRRTVTVEPEDEMKWSKPGKGIVKVAFSDNVLFRTEHHGVQWIRME